MKKKLFTLGTVLLLTLAASSANAQYFCFFVDNQSDQAFYELKIRPTGTGQAFSEDLLPEEIIEDGKHFWVKTGDDKYDTYDVQITNLEGKPLLFTWQDVNNKWHNSTPYISVNVKDLHTLVISSDGAGKLNYGVYNDDRFKYGHPCEN